MTCVLVIMCVPGPSSIPRDSADGDTYKIRSRVSTGSSGYKFERASSAAGGEIDYRRRKSNHPEARALFHEHTDCNEVKIDPDNDSSSSDDNGNEDTSLFSSICIWDKYPLCDHSGAHTMPDKMEWFVFPNGPIVVDSPARPDPTFSSFVLHAGEELEWFGICLTFYLRGYQSTSDPSTESMLSEPSWEQWTYVPENSAHDLGDDAYSEQPPRQDQWRWIGVCLCALTRAPFVEQLTQCLSVVYNEKIFPVLNDFEAASKGFPVETLKLDFADLMQALCFDCPSPVSDVLGVKLHCLGTTEYRNTSILFERSVLTDWPCCTYSLESFLSLVGVRTALDLVYHALAEHKILLYSSDTSKLPVVTEGIRTLIYPMQWCGAYIPVVPAPLLDMVGAPVPYILGIYRSHLSHVDPLVLKSVVVVDCDTGTICSSIPCIRFPDHLDRWIMMAFKTTWAAESMQGYREAIGYHRNTNTVKVFDRSIQICFFDAMLSILSWVPDCICNVSSGYPMFNREKFFDGYCPVDAKDLAGEIAATQAFHRFIASIRSPRLQLFVNAAKRMRFGYGYSNCRSCANNLSTEMYPFEDRRYGRDLEEILALGEISNPRCVLIPPYTFAEQIGGSGQNVLLLPEWIHPAYAASEFIVENALFSVLRRFRFSLAEPTLPLFEITINLGNNKQQSERRGLTRSKSFRDVVFPPMKFESPSASPGSASLHRRSWTCDELSLALKIDNRGDKNDYTEIYCCAENDHIDDIGNLFKTKCECHSTLLSKNDRDSLKLSKKMHAEYMFGEDVVMRFLLRILPAYSVDSIRDMDLSVGLQEACDMFSRRAARYVINLSLHIISLGLL